MLIEKKLFAAVWSNYPRDGQISGDCDEWVEIYSTLSEATTVCKKWATEKRGENLRIFVAQGLSIDGEYGHELEVF